MSKKRIVAYVRVSTDSNAQLHSYEFQENYWKDKFRNDAETKLIGIYADRGISGKSVSRRPQFQIMMQDARDGKFDVIYTKSVSRFARNTVELLEAVRELRDIGIEVVFENENISTKQPTSEIFLTIAATVAENDLMVDSERMRWSIRHRYENGWISIGSGLYGFTMGEDNVLQIVPEEAEVVRRIFDMYIGGMGCSKIAKALEADGIRTRNGKRWNSQVLLEMLNNEKYMGDAMMGKEVFHLGTKRSNANGEYGKRYYMEDTHEPIVSKETFKKAKDIRNQRKNKKLMNREKPIYPFTGIIECGNCGMRYNHKVNNSGKKWQTDIWLCFTQQRYGVSECSGHRIKDSVLQAKFIEAYNQFVTERPQGETIDTLETIIAELSNSEKELAALMMQRLIPESAFREEQKRIKTKIADIRTKINEQKRKLVRESDFTIIKDFDAEKVEKFITKVIVRDWIVTFVFYNGVKISRTYDNGQAGNKPGWNKKEEV